MSQVGEWVECKWMNLLSFPKHSLPDQGYAVRMMTAGPPHPLVQAEASNHLVLQQKSKVLSVKEKGRTNQSGEYSGDK